MDVIVPGPFQVSTVLLCRHSCDTEAHILHDIVHTLNKLSLSEEKCTCTLLMVVGLHAVFHNGYQTTGTPSLYTRTRIYI